MSGKVFLALALHMNESWCIMDWSVVINLVVSLLEYSFPFALIFGLVAKMTNFTLSMILDKKIEI